MSTKDKLLAVKHALSSDLLKFDYVVTSKIQTPAEQNNTTSIVFNICCFLGKQSIVAHMLDKFDVNQLSATRAPNLNCIHSLILNSTRKKRVNLELLYNLVEKLPKDECSKKCKHQKEFLHYPHFASMCGATDFLKIYYSKFPPDLQIVQGVNELTMALVSNRKDVCIFLLNNYRISVTDLFRDLLVEFLSENETEWREVEEATKTKRNDRLKCR